ncbi:hypothetical protein LPA44_04145 [Halobacterium sp. KA-4]|uniref:hypothetical protein n=1 Tax=Halobacterium sp. KA-4 TaxID=2896367 RepID=UPI001E545B94|nr:hypothetical protein [Halobacterium sp. KA-4]MCD2199090.1 hypothetical protein [Halobacterium sp. KA-4]
MPERCPRCGSTHDSLDGVANHAWKTQDDAHDDATSKDEGMRIAVEEEYSSDDQPPDDPPADSDSDSPDDDGDAHSNGGSSDPTVSDGPPDIPDDTDDSSDDLEEAPCGCTVDTADFEDGTVLRCTEHDKKFVYNE